MSLATFAAWFNDPAATDFGLLDGTSIVDQGVATAVATDDFCGTPRSDGAPDVGAVEYGAGACDTTVGGGVYVPEPAAIGLGFGAFAALAALRRPSPSRVAGATAPRA